MMTPGQVFRRISIHTFLHHILTEVVVFVVLLIVFSFHIAFWVTVIHWICGYGLHWIEKLFVSPDKEAIERLLKLDQWPSESREELADGKP